MNAGKPFTDQYVNDILKILESACKMSLQVIAYESDEDLYLYLQ